MNTNRRAALALIASSFLAACGGGSDSVEVSPPAPPPPAPPLPAPPPPPPATYFPPAGTAWESVAPADAGFDPAKLDELTSFVEQSSSSTFMILFGGRIVVEKYWGANATTLQDVGSVQKSITSLLVGNAVALNDFGLDDTVSSILGAGWSNGSAADEAPITVRHLLTMTSGLNTSLQRAAAPGTAWLYNNDAYHRLDPVLTQGTRKSLQDFTRATLFDAIGVGNSAWTKRAFQRDAKGLPMSALEMNARDMARIGLLVMKNGVWQDKTVVPSAFVSQALASSQALNLSYGFLFWLNGQPSARLPPSIPKAGTLIPSAPPDVVAALGGGDQKIYSSRATYLVVIRQGKGGGEPESTAYDEELWKRIMAAKVS